jgi:hypothetical protein
MLTLGRLHVKHAVQCGIWILIEQMFEVLGEPQKTVIESAVEGPSGRVLTSRHQFGGIHIGES